MGEEVSTVAVMEDLTLITEEVSKAAVMEDLTLTTEEVSMAAVMEDLTLITTMDNGMEASMMVTTTTKDLTLVITIMVNGMEASTAVGITEASILERMDNGTVKKVMVIILDMGMENKAEMERREDQMLGSSLVLLWV